MQPGDRLICAFVERTDVRGTFRTWPLHVTILPWLRLESSSDTIASGLVKALQPVNPFEVVMDGQAVFGPRRNRPAALVRLPTPFADIERRARNYFHKKRAWLVDETTKVRREFLPHVTAQGDKQMQPGNTFMCDRVYIVEQKGDFKQVAGEIILGT